ncbi:MAG: ORF6N domain-containing protein [Nitrospirae bacterium]|nr:ORF6N domain-containing protein [Nitrospirota bacterium]
MKALIPVEMIERKILLIRGEKVMLDADIAELYGVTTKRLNEQIRRNSDRFPEDFAFQLTAEEWQGIKSRGDLNRSQIATGSQKHRDPRFLPWVFTEHGAIMAATVLNSKQAVAMSVYVVRAFVKLREMIGSHKDLAKRLDDLEKKYDSQFKVVFDAIRQLMSPPETKKRKIGFRREVEKG